ncbi:(+)-trans-carveol dehydrogenase (plasmid) [Rhodococcus jostii RHA1]|uniref:SDR family mycofactocin-dependent oxidoreductase n=3 Tax=Rhodococcus TaxID=1827 RepID=A0A1H4LQA6_9NOCA|nr:MULTISPECIES: mycofactocin-coupled SDR family oxidoreductase [Rhodococcus]ABG99255.1 (+)-trans-carveol dehydrogenase [Rhodococcus jostii RHA1]GCE44698.1 3-oxoacyl-[acyl-carrier protein] reductase [Rhodococcus wratislaviensis]SEB72818.1 SDR family mycofactocin-dependent oxidoreductase [Rhodococcus koreensis]
MTGRLAGKVALISGAARGQGRSHAIRMAQEGADILAFDVCRQLDTVQYPLASSEDLKETQRLVETLGRRILTAEIDVRDADTMAQFVDTGVAEFGRLDIICANAAFTCFVPNTWSITEQEWDEMIGVNLTGVWKTVKAAIPAMIEAGHGGCIAITSSSAGTKGMVNLAHYVSAKHGVVGLMRTLANELAPHMIRVNTLHPTGVNTKLINNDHVRGFLETHPEWDANMANALPVDMVEPEDISNAIVWLASEEGRYVTGVSLPVDAGFAGR